MAAVRYVVYQSCIQLHHLWAHFVLSMPLHTRTVDWTLWTRSSSAPTHLILFIHLGYIHAVSVWVISLLHLVAATDQSHTGSITPHTHMYNWYQITLGLHLDPVSA